ncbi:hypothetical protein BU26DRAFT_546274 [Trematosphaeria pertusa]|uniref:Ankyrin 2,3/unc44 n=1 Tax=Trematosphaeria pertusa TaxID=390896 RepID=A0A6A6J3Y8_9PLEO|nr:uncharacterized protein BU26DRAFT_546274 [Trematosphaeria pertusa]KAF2257131.1 hypothetical protein BU26DRAFT_546274 [Trematosphaeria pertusa]
MESSEASAPKLFARDIAAYSDTELDRYLAENGRIVEVEDPENFPDDFIQRLRDRTRRMSETAESHPIDLDQVAALLQDVSADRERSRRSPSSATTEPPLTEGEQYVEDLRRQTGYYKMLVDDGGRPSHPLSRLEDIVKDPGEYREILSFWQEKAQHTIELLPGEWKVFETQLWRWKDFQSLQRFARGQRGYDYWRSLWDEERKMRSFESPGRSDPGISEERWEHHWQLYQKYDNYVRLGTSYMPWQRFIRRKGQTIGQQGFPEYTEALKERLERHGFTRLFQLDEDAARQDKITTWIEYLGYEYWWYDYYIGITRSHQKRHDNAWKKLVDSEVLRPGETEEVVCNIDTTFQDAGEKEIAKKAMQSAKLAVSSAETTIAKGQSKLSPQTLQQRLLAARSKLETTQAKYESLKRRSDCITEFIQRTEDYRITKKNAKHHDVLLRWMLQQIPLIEAELNPSNECGSDKSGRKNVLKRNRNRSEELHENSQEQSRGEGVSGPNPDQLAPAVVSFQEQPSKRPRRTASLSNNAVSNPGDPNLTKGTPAPKRERKPRKGNRQASSDQSRTSKPLRRSVRIAERAARLDAAITATTLAQTPTPSLSTLSRKRKGKRARTEMASQRRTSKPQGTSKRGRTYS